MQIIINGLTNSIPTDSKELLTDGNYWLNLLRAFENSAEHPPLGELLRCYHQLPGEWLITTPICWEATHNDAMIIAAGDDLLSDEREARAWYSEIEKFLAQDGFTLFFHDRSTWLIKPNNKSKIVSRSVNQMLHQSMMPALSTMDKTLYWQRLITETQMFFSSHQLNEKRAEQLPINGLWFYGGGELLIPDNRHIVSNDMRLVNTFPEKIRSFSDEVVFDKKTILLLDNDQSREAAIEKAKNSHLTIQWFWNNAAYQTPKKNHLKSWWRNLIHANKKKRIS